MAASDEHLTIFTEQDPEPPHRRRETRYQPRTAVRVWLREKLAVFRSWAAVHAALNGYGTAIFTLTFKSTECGELIKKTVTEAGWLIEQDGDWDCRQELVIVRTGPKTVGHPFEQEKIQSIKIALASIPNHFTLVPEFARPNFSSQPGWAIDLEDTPTELSARASQIPVIYGSYEEALREWKKLQPDAVITPWNAAARAIARPKESHRSLWLAGALVVLGFLLGVLLLSGPVISALMEPWVTGLVSGPNPNGYAPSVLAAALVTILAGGWIVRALALTILWFFWTDVKKSQFRPSLLLGKEFSTTDAARLESMRIRWPKNELGLDVGLKMYARTKFIFWLAGSLVLGVFLGVLSRIVWDALVISTTEGNAVPMLAALVIVLSSFVVVGLTSARTQLRAGSFPRLALGIGTAFVGLGLLLRLPVWAYLDGMGVAQFSNLVDWTGIGSISWNFLIALIVTVIAGAAAIWIFGRTGTFRALGYVMIMAGGISIVLTYLAAEYANGEHLVETGLAKYAQGNFPAAACLAPVQNGDAVEPVWILTIHDGRVIFTDRSEREASPLETRSSVDTVPAGDYSVSYVKENTTDGSATGQLCNSFEP